MQTLLSFLHVIGALVLFFIMHPLLWRTSWISKGVMSLIAIAIGSYVIGSGVLLWWSGKGSLSIFWVSVPLFSFAVMAYLHFYVGIDRSVSIRILGELVKGQKPQMTVKELAVLYPRETMVAHRLETLVAYRWLSYSGGNYCVTKKGTMLAFVYQMVKRLYDLEETG